MAGTGVQSHFCSLSDFTISSQPLAHIDKGSVPCKARHTVRQWLDYVMPLHGLWGQLSQGNVPVSRLATQPWTPAVHRPIPWPLHWHSKWLRDLWVTALHFPSSLPEAIPRVCHTLVSSLAAMSVRWPPPRRSSGRHRASVIWGPRYVVSLDGHHTPQYISRHWTSSVNMRHFPFSQP